MLQKIIALSLLLSSTAAWAESTISLSTGFDYSTGKYGGTTPTDILYIPVTGKYQTDNLYLILTVPYISITSTGVVVRVSPFRTVTRTKVTTESGLGDVTSAAGYTVFEGEQLMLDFVGKIKFSTADANKNLGSGENNYSAQLDGFYSLGKTTVLATAGYKVIGAPAGINVNNIIYATLGFSQKISDTIRAGMLLDIAQSSSNIIPGSRELSFFVSNKLNKTSKIQAGLMKGFSDGSPDFGFSVMITGAI